MYPTIRRSWTSAESLYTLLTVKELIPRQPRIQALIGATQQLKSYSYHVCTRVVFLSVACGFLRVVGVPDALCFVSKLPVSLHQCLRCPYSIACPPPRVAMLNDGSLMQSIMEGRGFPTTGPPAEASTVGMELRAHRLQDGTKVEFFDCAGQVDYAGMHQTFLSRRALYLLVVDITKYLDVDDLDEVGGRRCVVFDDV